MLFLIFLLQSMTFSHDVAMATFSLEQENNQLSLNVKLDKEDLEDLLQKDANTALNLTQNKQFLQQYIDEHFYLVVNEHKVDFRVEFITQNTYFYHINLLSTNKFDQFISHIQLKNTCLIDSVQGHSNVVHFKINKKSRSFRMHEGRKRIEVQY